MASINTDLLEENKLETSETQTSQLDGDVEGNEAAQPPIVATTAKSTSPLNGQSSNHQRQKRVRSQLSCTPCRQGKLKCNRQHDPACDQCLKRNRESACIYLPPPTKHKPPQNVKGRIRQLESLVVDLMNQNRDAQRSHPAERRNRHGSGSADSAQQSSVGPFSQPTPPSDNDTSPQFGDRMPQTDRSPSTDVDAATTPFGQMRISKDEIRYVGDAHWGTILNSISELKRDLEDDEEDDPGDENNNPLISEHVTEYWKGNDGVVTTESPDMSNKGSGFLLGATSPVTKEQLIRAVPDKKTTDRLLSLWFNSPDPFKPVIHAPTFQEEYRRFWRNPKETPAMWIGLMFAILSLAASFGLRDIDPNSPQAQQILAEVTRYHSLAASAAVLADFTKPKHHTLECLIIYSAGLRSNNAFVNVWLVVGLVVRLALRMGYHRDASHYPAITPFEGEMRRRCWAIISMIDVLISFQLGLPSMVRTITWDTQSPRNILDRDFNTATKELPPSRGIDELTPSSYTRAKLRLVRVFGTAAEMSHSMIPPSYDETVQLDRDLEEAKAAVPPLLQMPEISELVTDPAEQLMCRFNLDLLYLKTKLVLHRRHMLTPIEQLSEEEQKTGIGNSRKWCTEAALRVLHHHHTIYTASQTGGQLESVKWYMGSISTHDFLLAAMVVCLELSQQLKSSSFAGHPLTGVPCPKRRELMEALEKSQRIWSTAGNSRRQQMAFAGKDDASAKSGHMWDETEKAGRAMAVMVEKVKRQFGARECETPQPSGLDTSPILPPTNGTSPSDGSENDHQPTFASMRLLPRHQVHGIMPYNDWGNLDGIMDAYADPNALPFGANDPPAIAGTFTTPFSGAGVNVPSSYFANQPHASTSETATGAAASAQTDLVNLEPSEFPMIGDMLDVPVNLDWEMWDHEINGQPNTSGERLPADDIGNSLPTDGARPTDVFGFAAGMRAFDVDMHGSGQFGFESYGT